MTPDPNTRYPTPTDVPFVKVEEPRCTRMEVAECKLVGGAVLTHPKSIETGVCCCCRGDHS